MRMRPPASTRMLVWANVSALPIWAEKASYNLEVPVNDVEAVHIFHSARYS